MSKNVKKRSNFEIKGANTTLCEVVKSAEKSEFSNFHKQNIFHKFNTITKFLFV